jgi:hypothetical protein
LHPPEQLDLHPPEHPEHFPEHEPLQVEIQNKQKPAGCTAAVGSLSLLSYLLIIISSFYQKYMLSFKHVPLQPPPQLYLHALLHVRLQEPLHGHQPSKLTSLELADSLL